MAKKKKSVEIVIPIYNEEEELETNVLKLRTFLIKNLTLYNWKITIADNASTDGSLDIAKKLAKKFKRVGYFHLDQKGRGRAVKKVWQESHADVSVYMDVDLSTDLRNLEPVVKSLLEGYDIAIGSRLLSQSKVKRRPIKREVLSRGYNILIKLFFQTNFSDAQCGFKAVTRRTVKDLIPLIADNAWFFDSEMLILGEKLGYRIYEQPVLWVDNPGSTVRVLKTVYGDLEGLWRLFLTRPWNKLKHRRD
ncbi:glycosyltransferase [Patescibacteria group bacterium]|nr:glycosyltransferase [Patescibacteria group bacterium]MCL5797993.1 glycosyltransferase [Patescibacteria group bacterium]